jgi:hypothetical protein
VEDSTTLQMILVLGGIPGAVILIAMLAVLAPGWTRAGRYRPGGPWNYEPVLINASVSTDVKQAIEATATGELATPAISSGLVITAEGGASARW